MFWVFSIVNSTGYLEENMLSLEETKIRQFDDWNDYMKSTNYCRKSTEKEIQTGIFRFYNEGNKLININITELLNREKKTLIDNEDLTNFMCSNPLLEGHKGIVPCTCTFQKQDGEFLSIIDPHITNGSKSTSRAEYIFPFIKSERNKTVERDIYSQVSLEGYTIDKKKTKIDIVGVDVITLLNCIAFQRKGIY